MTYEFIKVSEENGIVLVTLSDPKTLNAVNPVMISELRQELDRVEKEPKARVLILTGEGKGFCSGANMKVMAQEGQALTQLIALPTSREQLFAYLAGTRKVVIGLRELSKPTIAAVNGPAIGAGMGLALGCDIRIVSETARFGWVFARHGIVPDDGSIGMLPQIVGYSKALELGTTGEIIDAREAERIGLVSKVVPPEEVIPAAKELANKIIKNCPPITVQLVKMVLSQALYLDPQRATILSDKAQGISRATEDHKEAIKAFSEKRPPVWKGR